MGSQITPSDIIHTAPGVILVLSVLVLGAALFVWALLRVASDDCDCPRKILRRRDSADGWAILTIHGASCPRKDCANE
jgi:hypothetical protein